MDTSFVWLYEALGTIALASLVIGIVATVTHYLEQETPWQPEKKNKH
jgi:heme exporter protein D